MNRRPGAGPAARSSELAVRVMLAEYEQLKDEQVARIGFRDNLIYAVLIASAAVGSAAAARGGGYLLLLPPPAVLLGWTYLVNDAAVTAIGRYLRDQLGPALTAAGAGQAVFGWEQARLDRHRAVRKRFQLAADLLAFSVLPAAALAVYWAGGPWPVPLVAVSAAEAALLAALAWQITRHADLPARSAARSRRATRRGRC